MGFMMRTRQAIFVQATRYPTSKLTQGTPATVSRGALVQPIAWEGERNLVHVEDDQGRYFWVPAGYLQEA